MASSSGPSKGTDTPTAQWHSVFRHFKQALVKSLASRRPAPPSPPLRNQAAGVEAGGEAGVEDHLLGGEIYLMGTCGSFICPTGGVLLFTHLRSALEQGVNVGVNR
jgi:hypothetical protein